MASVTPTLTPAAALSAPQVQATATRRRSRDLYLDNFRLFLTILVIYHHTAIPYGGTGLVSYQSSHHSPASSLVLLAFNGINQSYFMAAFFFLSGYYSSVSVRRNNKSKRAFVLAKFIRLGMPTLVYTVVAEPMQKLAMHLLLPLSTEQRAQQPRLDDNWVAAIVNSLRNIRGVRGPVWYLGVLLIFDIIYISLVPTTGTQLRFSSSEKVQPTTPTARTAPLLSTQVYATLGLCIIANFLIRASYYPISVVFTPLFLQPGFLPQYIAAYVFGTTILSSPADEARISRRAAIRLSLLSLSSATAAILLLHQFPAVYKLESARGGINPIALCYAVWNETTGLLLGLGLLHAFKKMPERDWGSITRKSYAIFLVHMPVSIAVESALDGWRVGGLVKTAVVGSVNTVASVGAASLLVKLPWVGKVVQ